MIKRNLKIETLHPEAKKGVTPGLRTPIIFSDSKLNLSKGVPRLGEHTKEILERLK